MNYHLFIKNGNDYELVASFADKESALAELESLKATGNEYMVEYQSGSLSVRVGE